MKGVKFTPTPEQLQYLIDNFPNTINAELASHLGIGMRTMSRIASDLGLTKSNEFLHQRSQKAIDALRRWNINNPKPPGFRIPNSENYQFRKGTSIRSRQGEEVHQRAVAKRATIRRETIKQERRRILFGLPQKTNLRLTAKPREKVLLRYYLRTRGYIIDDDKRMAYYTDSTKRGARIERKQQPWYTFAPYPTLQDPSEPAL